MCVAQSLARRQARSIAHASEVQAKRFGKGRLGISETRPHQRPFENLSPPLTPVHEIVDSGGCGASVKKAGFGAPGHLGGSGWTPAVMGMDWHRACSLALRSHRANVWAPSRARHFDRLPCLLVTHTSVPSKATLCELGPTPLLYTNDAGVEKPCRDNGRQNFPTPAWKTLRVSHTAHRRLRFLVSFSRPQGVRSGYL